jgi:hypothetical protein
MAYEEMIIRKQQNFDAVSGEEKYKEKLSYYQADELLSWVSFKSN